MKFKEKIIDLRDLPNIEQLLFVGDIHGEFKTFVYNIENHNITNAIVVICGDVGLGFNKPNYYATELSHLEKTLNELNVYVICVRGNHDNPAWFTNDLFHICPTLANELKHWIIVDDYDIIKTEYGNILTIGGARSIDKKSRTANKDWWEGENVKPLDTFTLLDLTNHNDVNIVVSHSAPIFCGPIGVKSSIVDMYATYDKTLNEDLTRERELLVDIYNKLSTIIKIEHWFYGHFHNNFYMINENDTKFHGLGILKFKGIKY